MPRSRLPIKALVLALALCATQPGSAAAPDPGWPREMVRDDATLVYYQPQIDDWKDFKQLNGRMAVSITPRGGKPQVGIVALQMQTDVDIDTRNVLLSNPQITSATFPGADAETARKLDSLMRQFLNAKASMTISLDRLAASIDKKPAAPVAAIRNDPPQIFVSFGPGLLLFVDGEPVPAPVLNSDITFVVNASWPLFVDKTAHQYYLFTGQSWMTSTDLKTGWTPTGTLPPTMSKVPTDPTWSDLKPYIPPPKKQSDKPPAVFFSSTPAEIIAFDGQPVYAAIAGTGLVFARNTDSDVFVFSPTHTYYYLNAGRWYSAPDLRGPWTFATDQLPPDFATIPRDSPAARVLASVPGTPEASDAVLLAQIPTTVEINPTAAAAAVKVVYNGDPQFAPITGTALSYATNTPDKVIKVQNRYYLCSQGVWFDSASPGGPWQTTKVVPAAIYTIPPASPVYNVTYVTQQVTPTGYVQASYTAGYLGIFIAGAAIGAIVANGNGYYYPPYIGVGGRYPVYYPRPMPHGYPTYNPYTGASGMRGGVYGPAGSARWATSYNPNTGTYARGATASGRYGSASVAQAYNPYTGAYAATRQGSNAYGQWGSSVVTRGNQWAATQHASTARGTVATYQNSAGAKAIGSRSIYGNAAAGKTAGGDLYAGRDGNVYKNTDGSWQKYDNGQWSSVDKPTPQTSGQKVQSAQAQRATGTTNTAAARQTTPASQRQAAAGTPKVDAQAVQQKAQSYQQQRPGATQMAQSTKTQQRTQSAQQQQRPTPSNGTRPAGRPQGPAAVPRQVSAQSLPGGLNQDMQNRQRGAMQSQRYAQSAGAGFAGGNGMGARGGGGLGRR
jgi:uncharacterized ParB-like nuclease family protein